MKKILIALSEEHFSEEAFDFALGLNRLSPVQLTAAFVPQPVLNNSWNLVGTPPEAIPILPPLLQTDPAVYEAVRSRFIQRCLSNDIPFRLHEGMVEIDLTELKKEARYADLLVLGTGGLFDKLFAESGWDNLGRLLHWLECPAVIIPKSFHFPEKNIVAFDGSRDSVHAIKQFYLTLPELAANPTYLTFASSGTADRLPDLSYIEELALQHFPDLTLTHLTGKPRPAFSKWVQEHPRSILVCGAMGRGGLSRLFRESFAHETIAACNCPVFIAHS